MAVLLGRLGKTLEECEEIYRKFGSKIFAGGSAYKTAKMAWTGSKHSGESLAEVVRSQAGREIMFEADATMDGHIPVSWISILAS